MDRAQKARWCITRKCCPRAPHPNHRWRYRRMQPLSHEPWKREIHSVPRDVTFHRRAPSADLQGRKVDQHHWPPEVNWFAHSRIPHLHKREVDVLPLESVCLPMDGNGSRRRAGDSLCAEAHLLVIQQLHDIRGILHLPSIISAVILLLLLPLPILPLFLVQEGTGVGANLLAWIERARAHRNADLLWGRTDQASQLLDKTSAGASQASGVQRVTAVVRRQRQQLGTARHAGLHESVAPRRPSGGRVASAPCTSPAPAVAGPGVEYIWLGAVPSCTA